MKSAATAAKARERGLTVLERQAEADRVVAEKEAVRRPRAAARRSQSTPPQKDKNGGEQARGRGRQRINQTSGRSGSGMLERRSRSLMSKKDLRRSVVVNSVAPAGGAVLSRCPERTDHCVEQPRQKTQRSLLGDSELRDGDSSSRRGLRAVAVVPLIAAAPLLRHP